MRIKLLIEKDGPDLDLTAKTETYVEELPESWASLLATARQDVDTGVIDAYGVVDIEVPDTLIAKALARTAAIGYAQVEARGGR